MKLSQLLLELSPSFVFGDGEITGVTNDSRKVQPGFLYTAVRGTVTDGHNYCASALEKGAGAIVVDHDLGLEKQVIVPDTAKAYSLLCAAWFGHPARQLKLAGITGTNGKTSSTTILRDVLEHAGHKAGLIGTIQIEYDGKTFPNPNTTPDSWLFQKTLRDMVDAGCDFAVTEVSSHALVQQRLYGCEFAAAAFTNLTQDHLDYHKTMEAYFQAKTMLFGYAKKRVVNIHDPYGKRVAEMFPDGLTTFSVSDPKADLFADEIQNRPDSVHFTLHYQGGAYPVHFAIPGSYSVENALTAIGMALALEVPLEKVLEAVEAVRGICGRSEVLYSDSHMTVMRDYAHTPDGIVNILSSIRSYSKGRVVAVFGCGGDRDKTKRPKMAAAAEQYADFLVVTSDNPRSEDPDAIIDDVLAGLSPKANYIRITDRRAAIDYALTHAREGDIIVLLGKGHETYQILKDKTIHFDEKEVVEQLLEEHKGEGEQA